MLSTFKGHHLYSKYGFSALVSEIYLCKSKEKGQYNGD